MSAPKRTKIDITNLRFDLHQRIEHHIIGGKAEAKTVEVSVEGIPSSEAFNILRQQQTTLVYNDKPFLYGEAKFVNAYFDGEKLLQLNVIGFLA